LCRRCLRIAEQIRPAGGRVLSPGASVGIAAGIALAAALPELPYACGLATLALLDGDVTSNPSWSSMGALAVSRPVPDRRAASPQTKTRCAGARKREAAAVRTVDDRGAPE